MISVKTLLKQKSSKLKCAKASTIPAYCKQFSQTKYINAQTIIMSPSPICIILFEKCHSYA